MSDISRNNIRTAFTADASHNNINNYLYTIVNEMLNGIEDDEIQDTNDFNPFLHRRRRNYTIGRNIDSSSSLFNMINQVFDISRNIHSNVTENDETDNNEPIVEQITFQVTYPLNLNIPSNIDISNNESSSEDNRNNISSNLNDLGSTINSLVTNSVNSAFGSSNMNLFGSYMNNTRPFGTTIRRYHNTRSIPYSNDSFSNGGIFPQILSQSLYDESAYKKKISEKGKTQLIHIRFDKNNPKNINTACPINQTDFENEQYVIQLPCNHMFIPDAINRWLDEKPECPVCRFELDSIEVKREFGTVNNSNDVPYENLYNSNETRIAQSSMRRPMNSNTSRQSWLSGVGLGVAGNSTTENGSRYDTSIRQTRMMGRDRIHLNDNSYLDYLYEEIDNDDFQAALILSYRELMDISGYDSSNTSTNTETENQNETQNEDCDSTIDTFETVAAYVSDNIPDASNEDSEITESSENSMSDTDSSISDYYADND